MDGTGGSPQQLAAQLQSLSGRLASCSAGVEKVLGGFQDIQMLDWQSPAGRAYRDAVAHQAASLRRALDRLEEAGRAVARRAQEDGARPLAPSGWPG
ncbi:MULTISPECIES: hypothetical protein [Pseudarthrobacter]|uniref:MarR-like DNA-binding transcriptional regulator SgrR of sgrS sRNA n=2 Tax=Pseudarthrobacter TaxID=1742993 RepID=A0ABT9RWN6_9MICC|nr:hypothetical protein [Pseudarthrobacter enclensis]MDP9889211.1 MarR-like DNA-binding transcriptional regulator SgrR of sgrS sRNA [Pseudarthrobacter enclensis]